MAHPSRVQVSHRTSNITTLKYADTDRNTKINRPTQNFHGWLIDNFGQKKNNQNALKVYWSQSSWESWTEPSPLNQYVWHIDIKDIKS